MTLTERLSQWLVPILGFTLLLFPAAVAGFRLDVWDFSYSFLLIQLQVIILLIVLLLGAGCLVAVIRRGNSALKHKMLGVVVLSALIISLLGHQAYKAKTLPFIHDVTTDVQTPPEFVAVASLRGPGDHSVDYQGQTVSEQQLRGYPDLVTLVTPMPAADAYIRMKGIVERNGWTLVADDPESGHLEAVVVSRIFGFMDDVVVRISRAESATKIDIRSASRIGRSDLGANVKRIRMMVNQFNR